MRNVRDYALVTGAYWIFTITDGALRMLVLLHLHELGYGPVAIASLFLFYEAFGVVTNLVGGWLGARFGLTRTLHAGLALQIVACGCLAGPPEWLSVPYLMAAQALSGIAKDLTKMSSKSYIRLVVPEGDSRGLMKWISILTGSKNTLKGVGFFVGAALLSTVGFRAACGGMSAALAVPLLASGLWLPAAAGKAVGLVPFSSVFSRDARVNWLSAARFFLFGSRDVWFVLALPIYLTDALGWTHRGVGGFLALWIVGYGFVQASAPRLAGGGGAPTAARLGGWTAVLLLPLAALLVALRSGAPPGPSLIAGLAVFGAVFAVNSAVHSYLVVHYAEEDRVSLAVGFYYTANAAGRLVGTVLSGVVFHLAGEGAAGLEACLGGSLALVAASAVVCLPLGREESSRRDGAATG